MQPGHIDVWRMDLLVSEEDYAHYYNVLDTSEKKRAAAFLDDKDRRQWVAAHGQMRMILAKYTGIPAVKIPIIQQRGEKPFIEDSQVKFNLSHTNGWALLAVTTTGDVGIDIELMRDNAKIELISRSTFSESERRAILSTEGIERRDRFFRCWTRKEAFIKAIGKGFSYDTKSFSVTVESDDSSRFIQFDTHDFDFRQWTLLSFIPYANTKAALAFAFTLAAIHFFDMSADLSFEQFLPPMGEENLSLYVKTY